jgi:hypothetical protein
MEVSDQFHDQTTLSTGKELSVSIAEKVQYLLPFPGSEPLFHDHPAHRLVAVPTGIFHLTLHTGCVTSNHSWPGLVLEAWKQML